MQPAPMRRLGIGLSRLALVSAGLSALSPEQLAAENPPLRELLGHCSAASVAFDTQLFVPMIVRGELVGVVLLGQAKIGIFFNEIRLEDGHENGAGDQSRQRDHGGQ